MKNLKNFEQWLKEDFAAVGVAPEGNVSGMGPVVAPTSTSVGSGDAWPAINFTKTRKKRKPKKKKINENKKNYEDELELWFNAAIDGDVEPLPPLQRKFHRMSSTSLPDPLVNSFTLLGMSIGDTHFIEFIDNFSTFYDCGYNNWRNCGYNNWRNKDAEEIFSTYSSGDYAWITMTVDNDGYSKNSMSDFGVATENGWKPFDSRERTYSGGNFIRHAVFIKKLSAADKLNRSHNIVKFLKKNEHAIESKLYMNIAHFVDESDKHLLKTGIISKKYNV